MSDLRDDVPDALTGCLAPAKLNLFLHVVGRREDGYHLLQSVFQLVDLCDRLDFALRTDGVIERVTDIEGVPAETDLCVRAARALKTASGTSLGVSIVLDKHIPMGGGVGGGSSDAATTLMALNRLWRLDMSAGELAAIGVSLGADVPFFLFGSNALVEGIGEKITPVVTPERFYALIHPGVSVSTVVVFGASELTRDTLPIKMSDFCAGASAVATERLGIDFGHNDLEMVARTRFPEVAAALEWLSRFGNARMTGSGACVFVACSSRVDAEACIADLPKTWRGWACRGYTHHPLADWLTAAR